jgi:hypothetical protein
VADRLAECDQLETTPERRDNSLRALRGVRTTHGCAENSSGRTSD